MDVMTAFQQSFPYVAGVELGKGNELRIGTLNLRPGEEWTPLGFSSNAKLDCEIAFVGFGLTASELNHDDYSSGLAKGRIAIALQGTPDGDNPHGQFARLEGVRWKAVAARNAGAKALIVIAREENFMNEGLARLTYDNSGGEAGLPVLVISRQAADQIFKLSRTTLILMESGVAQKTAGTQNFDRRLVTDDRHRPKRVARIQPDRRSRRF
jgi:hypothetical protein